MAEADQQIELELTYLAKALPPGIKTTPPEHITDIYIPKSDNDPHLRLRQRGDRYEITHKQPVDPGDVSHQTEKTITLTAEEFQALAVAEGRHIEKDRYECVIDGNNAEIDIFTGGLDGLVVIDFEFDSHADKDNFVAPDICLADVTQEDFIAGGHLAGKSYDDIKSELDRFGYRALSL